MKTTVTGGYVSRNAVVEFPKGEISEGISLTLAGEVRKSQADEYPSYPSLQIQIDGQYCGQISKQANGEMILSDIRGAALAIVGAISEKLSIIDASICEAFTSTGI